MAHCVISDGEATAKLVLWENDVKAVQRGKAFNFEQLRVRMEDKTKVLNTTRNMVISENNNDNLKKVEAKDFNLESNIKTIVSKIDVIEHFSTNKVRAKCNKHIIQTTSEYTLKCDFCKYIMRQDSCKSSVVVKIVVTDSSLPSENNDIHLVLFQNELIKLLKTEDVYDEQFVSSSLFKLENLKVTFESKRNVVKNIEQL